jgi:hypothetical protein
VICTVQQPAALLSEWFKSEEEGAGHMRKEVINVKYVNDPQNSSASDVRAAYKDKVVAFCATILELQSPTGLRRRLTRLGLRAGR